MAKEKSSAIVGFEEQIWKAADILRGNMDAAEYKHVVLGLIFLKYISDKFEERYAELVADDDDVEDKDAYTEKNVFFILPSARWSVIAAAAYKEEVGAVIDDAMRAIEKEDRRLKDVLPKNFARGELDKRRLGEVVDLFTNIRMTDRGDNKDILGSTYQYCLAQFASKEGKHGGEYYTPSYMVRTLVAVLKPTAEHRIYDPCCGSGGMFVQSGQFVREHSGGRGTVSIYGQESNPTTRKLAIMNLAIRGIEADLGPYNADTFSNDFHPTLKADYILANPPFNLSDWKDGSLRDDVRWKYGLPPNGNANFAWLQHMIHHLAPNGKIGMVLANDSLSSQSGGEGEIRRKIVEADLVEGIVAMPSNLFYGVTIPATLWFVSRDKNQKGKTLFIDARKLGTLVDRVHRELSETEIQKIADTFDAFNAGKLTPQKGFCAAVTTEEIAKQDFILTPGRHVGIEEEETDDDPFEQKMKRLTSELSEMFKRSRDSTRKSKSNWEASAMKCELGAICSRLSSGKSISAKLISAEGKYPVCGGNGLRGYSNVSNIDDECAIVGRQGAFCGNVRYFKGAAYMTEHAIVVCADGKNDTRYLAYLLSHMELGRLSAQSAQPGLSVKTLSKQIVDVPLLETQKRIAAILSSLDEKIENNKQVNRHLEQMAQALFKSWFVDFAPFSGKMPKEWRERDVYSIADIIYGAPFESKIFNEDRKGKPIVRIRDLGASSLATYTTENHPRGYLIQPGNIIVGMDGEFRPYIWGNEEAWLNQRVCVFANKRPQGKAFLYCLVKPMLLACEQIQGATTVIHIGKKDFDAFRFILPTDEVLNRFDALTNPMVEQIVCNKQEKRRLAELRDALLPRLISGE